MRKKARPSVQETPSAVLKELLPLTEQEWFQKQEYLHQLPPVHVFLADASQLSPSNSRVPHSCLCILSSHAWKSHTALQHLLSIPCVFLWKKINKATSSQLFKLVSIPMSEFRHDGYSLYNG